MLCTPRDGDACVAVSASEMLSAATLSMATRATKSGQATTIPAQRWGKLAVAVAKSRVASPSTPWCRPRRGQNGLRRGRQQMGCSSGQIAKSTSLAREHGLVVVHHRPVPRAGRRGAAEAAGGPSFAPHRAAAEPGSPDWAGPVVFNWAAQSKREILFLKKKLPGTSENLPHNRIAFMIG